MKTPNTTFFRVRVAGLFATAMLLCTLIFAQPGGQAAGGGNDETTGQKELENECLRLLEKTRAPESHHYQQPHRPLVVIGEEVPSC